ncbi:TraB/GumN family protein [Agaribacterium haliotis]|uniref:TraB/GumN family protein n=1 Tax=Agaribacterium haliotis TaxID=2013869 RepID=UPI000BB54A81|nr:TraB/GumN family protein [Agaribacterium haliotis]
MLVKKIVVLLSLLLVCSVSIAQSSVWKVEKPGRVLYLAGTMHLLEASDHPLPSSYEKAYAAASVVVFETDLTQANSAEAQMKIMQALMARPGKTLEQVLKAKTYRAVENYFSERALPLASFTGLSASGLSLTMISLELQRLGYQAAFGVDQYFQDKAINDNKISMSLESLDFQIGMLANLGEGKEDEIIEYTLSDLARLPAYVADLKAAWRKGDLAGIEKESIVELREQFPDIYRRLLLERNQHWLPQIHAMLNTQEVELVLVGAAHLAGSDGLLQALERSGAKLTQMP